MGEAFDRLGQRWHLPALPTTLARLALSRSGKTQGEAPTPPIIRSPVPTIRGWHKQPKPYVTLVTKKRWVVSRVRPPGQH